MISTLSISALSYGASRSAGTEGPLSHAESSARLRSGILTKRALTNPLGRASAGHSCPGCPVGSIRWPEVRWPWRGSSQLRLAATCPLPGIGRSLRFGKFEATTRGRRGAAFKVAASTSTIALRPSHGLTKGAYRWLPRFIQ